MRSARRTACSAVRTAWECGTGRPAAPSSLAVSSLSEAMSRPERWSVRSWWPGSGVDAHLPELHQRARVQADVRDVTAGSFIDEGLCRRPNAYRSASSRKRSSSWSKSNCGSGSTMWLTRRTASRPAATLPAHRCTHRSRGTGRAHRPIGSSAPDLMACLGLQLQRHMLGHVTQPRALPQRSRKPPRLPVEHEWSPTPAAPR